MTNKKLFLHSIIITYLMLTIAALGYTLFRVELLPKDVVLPFYGMMAPFQGYATHNVELVAQGRVGKGVWSEIDLHPYIPAGRGEFAYRGFSFTQKQMGPRADERYALFAEKLLQAEARRGREYDHVRLLRRSWPTSPAGYYYLNRSLFRTDTVLYSTAE